MSSRFQAILEIYYCAAFLVYSVLFLTFFWELGSLLLRFTLTDILGFLAYQLAFALAESLIVAAFVALLVWLVPLRQVRENRSVVGGMLVFSFGLSALIYKAGPRLVRWLGAALPVNGAFALQIVIFTCVTAIVALPVISIQMVRNPRFAAPIKAVMDNLSVLAGIYTLLGVIGSLIVIYRNLA